MDTARSYELTDGEKDGDGYYLFINSVTRNSYIGTNYMNGTKVIIYKHTGTPKNAIIPLKRQNDPTQPFPDHTGGSHKFQRQRQDLNPCP